MLFRGKLFSINYRLKFTFFFDKRVPYFTLNLRTVYTNPKPTMVVKKLGARDSSTSMPILNANRNLFAKHLLFFIVNMKTSWNWNFNLRTSIHVPSPETNAANWSHNCGDFMKVINMIFDNPPTVESASEHSKRALFKIYISLMDVQTSTVGTENCDNIEYNERTIVAGWAKKICTYHLVCCSADSRLEMSFFSHSPAQHKISFYMLARVAVCCVEIKWT